MHNWDQPAVFKRKYQSVIDEIITVWSLSIIHSNTSKVSNPRKMAKLQVQVRHFETYTDEASQLTNFEWKADN